MMEDKTHYRKAFNSPYLSSADIVEPTIFTIKNVLLTKDKSKRTKDMFNTAFFVEKEIRQGEELKPMILNACNSRTMKALTGSPYIDDWNDVPVTVYVDKNVSFGRDTVEGLRISTEPPRLQKPDLLPDTTPWKNAIVAYKRDGNLDAVKKRMSISPENEALLVSEAENVS
ncbi:MAG: hypothetical protein GY820_39205 [Gammaproteobacteria bacterium]|nr:hypothetical protein [Gammaproteobacteria bacterium]